MPHYQMDSNKLIWHMDRVYDHYRDGKRIYPLHVDMGVTKVCNAKCVFCYGIFQKMTGEIIPSDILLRFFQDAPKLGIKSITITGDGEPTLNPGIYDAVETGKVGGLDIGFATNGIALTSTKMAILLNSCTWLRFNLSAVENEGYKSIHGVDCWKRVKGNIEQTVKIKKELGSECTIGLQMVLIPEALSQVYKEAQFAVETGVDYFVIKQFSDPGCDEMSRFDLDAYDEMVVELKMAEQLSNDQTKIIPKYDTIASKGKKGYDRCVDCALLFQISGSGKCYPCGFLFGDDRYCYGDLHKQTLKEILDSDHYWDLIKHMKERFDVHKECNGSCRHDSCNSFIWEYLNPPEHLSFI